MRARILVLVGVAILAGVPVWAQDMGDLAMNAPDELAWRLFLEVNTRAGGTNALFETWASDTDTFQLTPVFPSGAQPLSLHAPIVPGLGRLAIQQEGGLLPSVPPTPGVGEETRRNRPAFDFIVANNLYKISGLKNAFGKSLSFPIPSIEVKANWLPVGQIPAFTLNRVTLADVPKFFHVNTGSDGKQYALVAMHVISKIVPNWTWATFEHQLNPGRCDYLGCIDQFGATANLVKPNATLNAGYPACAKTSALTALFAGANVDPLYTNYCLKGSQVDFTDNTGLAIRVGNSITEEGFVDRASCITCHGRANITASGHSTTVFGRDASGFPLGALNPAWDWTFTAPPPIYQGMPGLALLASSADFVWSIPFCAIDDTQTPTPPSRCKGK